MNDLRWSFDEYLVEEFLVHIKTKLFSIIRWSNTKELFGAIISKRLS
jgi:hypothetical protein